MIILHQFPSEHRAKGCALTYTDPEFQKIGVLTPKSDNYFLGMIILQLLAGRLSVGKQLRCIRQLHAGIWLQFLDPLAIEWNQWTALVARQLVHLGLINAVTFCGEGTVVVCGSY